MAGGNDTGDNGSISGINVTPLVDVMLVLLVIFMVTAPIMQQGVQVALPRVGGGELAASEQEPLVVSVTADGGIHMGEEPLALDALVERVGAVLEQNPGQAVYVRGDEQANYGVVVRVVAALRQSGVERLGLVTEPGAT